MGVFFRNIMYLLIPFSTGYILQCFNHFVSHLHLDTAIPVTEGWLPKNKRCSWSRAIPAALAEELLEFYVLTRCTVKGIYTSDMKK